MADEFTFLFAGDIPARQIAEVLKLPGEAKDPQPLLLAHLLPAQRGGSELIRRQASSLEFTESGASVAAALHLHQLVGRHLGRQRWRDVE